MSQDYFGKSPRRGAGWRAVVLTLLPGVALAQSIVVTPLSNGAGNSIAYAIGSGQQAGFDGVAAAHATLWTGTAGSAVDLNPSGAYASLAYATNGLQQGGRANFTNTNGTDHAALWSGTAGSFVDLHPAGATYSVVNALTSTQQGGAAVYGGFNHAFVWSGTAASGVDLHPVGASASQITAMTAMQQGGLAGFGSNVHAALWSGTAGSFLDLNPAGASDSYLYAMAGGSQGGVAYFSTTPHAGLWSGTAGSFVDLDPGTGGGSVLCGLAGNFQVGAALALNGAPHAALWQGSAATYFDLQPVITTTLGANYTWSTIRGVELVGSTLYLVGEAADPIATSTLAFLITAPTSAVPEPATAAIFGGLTALGLVVSRRQRIAGTKR